MFSSVRVTGPAVFDLFFEKRNNRTVGTEHVAETHGDKFRFGMFVHRLYDHFADTLGRPHDVGGIDGFIRGNLHKTFHAVFIGNFRQLICAADIVFHRLVRARFHQRHVLVRSRVEYDLRAVFIEHIVEFHAVAHTADQHEQIELRPRPLQLLFDIVSVVFINIEYD